MPGTMSRADVVADLQASLHDAADVFEAADLDRVLDAALLDFSQACPRTLLGTLSLVADQADYAAPADCIGFKYALWGTGHGIQPWDKRWPGRLPDAVYAEGVLTLSPAPTSKQVSVLGTAYRFYYFASHTVAAQAADTTVPANRRGLLLLRSQAEACRELALRGITKPVTLRDGVSQGPRNGTPAALWQALMGEFESRVRA